MLTKSLKSPGRRRWAEGESEAHMWVSRVTMPETTKQAARGLVKNSEKSEDSSWIFQLNFFYWKLVAVEINGKRSVVHLAHSQCAHITWLEHRPGFSVRFSTSHGWGFKFTVQCVPASAFSNQMLSIHFPLLLFGSLSATFQVFLPIDFPRLGNQLKKVLDGLRKSIYIAKLHWNVLERSLEFNWSMKYFY